MNGSSSAVCLGITELARVEMTRMTRFRLLRLEKCAESPARMVTALAGDVEYVDSASLLTKLGFADVCCHARKVSKSGKVVPGQLCEAHE